MTHRSLVAGRARWPLLCAALAATAGLSEARKPKDDTFKKVSMPHHSFTTPLEYTSLLDDWAVSGTSIFERERLLLHPDVPERAGFAFSKTPLLTNDFEVIFHFRVAGDRDGSKVPHDQAFGLWYVKENISEAYNETRVIKAPSWREGLTEQGFTLLGMKASYDGFGAVLTMTDSEKRPKPSVSFVPNDGHQPLVFGSDVPLKGAKVIEFRNTLNAAQLKVRVRPTEVEAHLKLSPSLSWNECFKVDRSKRPIPAGGYLGFTAWSGSASEGLKSDLVSIVQVEVTNYDETSIGEDMRDVSAKIQDAYKEMLTDEKRHFADQRAQKDHLVRLAKMLGEHINTTRPAEERLFAEIEELQSRLGRIDDDCRELAAEFRVVFGEHGGHPDSHRHSVEAMKNDIIGLRRLLVKDSASHMQKLEAVSKNVAEVKQKSKVSHTQVLGVISKQAESLEQTVKTRGVQLSWMMVCMMVAVVSIGGLMWNRMQYYEKKHFI